VDAGENKPLKYPVMFRKADLVLITKTDLLPYLDVRVEAIGDALSRVMPRPLYFPISARTGAGVDLWLEWLEQTWTNTSASHVFAPQRQYSRI
jgi:hydrogenase nickel incorporation protein HypB